MIQCNAERSLLLTGEKVEDRPLLFMLLIYKLIGQPYLIAYIFDCIHSHPKNMLSIVFFYDILV